MGDRERKRLTLQDDNPPADRPRARLRLNDTEEPKKTASQPIKRDLVERHKQYREDRKKIAVKKAAYAVRVIEPKSGGRYFDREATLNFFSSGCKLVDLALGGGWVCGRISNVVGDRSSGKTLMAIEAMANYARTFANPTTHKIRYFEVEDAFDDGYAEVLGMPLSRVARGGHSADTVRDFEKDLETFCESIPAGGGGLYIIDSLDALSDNEELKGPKKNKQTGEEKGSYGTAKAKAMSRMFRRLVRKIGRANVHLMVISQVRDKIGVTFGEKKTRAGGKALDFYASHIVWLAEIGKIKVTRKKVKRAIGVQVKLQVKKNKVALPFREVEYPILFAYGVDDVRAALEWLAEVDRLGALDMTSKDIEAYMRDFHRMTPKEAGPERKRINKVLRREWYDIEKEFLPPQGKY